MSPAPARARRRRRARGGAATSKGGGAEGRRAVLVLGMHRSGTSALARIVNLLGADAGSDLMPPAPGVNERGFWESLAVVDLHDRLLGALGSEWCDPGPLGEDWWQRSEVVPYRRELADLLRREFGGSPLWMVKDPRLCRLLPLWGSALEELGANPSCLFILRNPLEVAQSLERRDGLPPTTAWALWLDHYLSAVEHSQRLPRAFLAYDELLADWERTLGVAAQRLGLTWPRPLAEARADVHGFLTGELRHERVADASLDREPDLSRWVRSVYGELRRAAELGETPALARRLSAVRREFRAAQHLFGAELGRERRARLRLEELARVGETAGRELAGARASLLEREAELSALRAQAESSAREALAAAARLEAQGSEAAALREAVLARGAELAALREVLGLRAGELAGARASLLEREAELSALRARAESSAREALASRERVAASEVELSALRVRLEGGERELALVGMQLEARRCEVGALQQVAQARRAELASAQAVGEARSAELAALRQAAALQERELQAAREREAAGRAELALLGRELGASSAQLTEAGSRLEAERARGQEREGELAAAQAALAREAAARGELEGRARRLSEALEEREAFATELFASRFWRWSGPFRAAWRVLRVTGPERLRGARRRHARLLRNAWYLWRTRGLRAVVRKLRQKLAARRGIAPPAGVDPALRPGGPWRFIAFPAAPAPEVSVIIPARDHFSYTHACLEAVLEHTGGVAYEVIVVDDGSRDETLELPKLVRNARVLRRAASEGFLASCNWGAREARGELLVFLNNDALVRPGWLEALVAALRDHADVGAVGGKLLYPDGTLQEAGGIVWRDGSGWNFGRSQDPNRPEYSYVREVDYCSAACLLVPRSLFLEIGMFDARYAPAYYEDTDLCFAVRAAGQRVLFQPAAEVVHFEGVSSGRDPSQGVKRHQVANQEAFARKWAADLAHQLPNGADPWLARERGVHRSVLVVDARTPMPDHDSGSLRMFRLLQILRELSCRVTFLPENLAHAGRYTAALQQLGVECLHAPHADSLERHLREVGDRYDAVILSRFGTARTAYDAVRKHCRKALLVFDTVDLHFLREAREAALRGLAAVGRELEHRKRAELELARGADAVLVVSEEERAVLAAEIPEARVEVLSNIHVPEPTGAPFEAREGIVFIGGFEHPPNVDALEYYAREIHPRVQEELPGVVLTVIGADASPELLSLASDTIRFAGHVLDIEPCFEACRLSVAPLRFGAGVKGKLNTSMSYGVPVVSTSIGAEGLGATPGVDLLLADDPDSFAAAVVRAYLDAQVWETLRRGGLANIEKRFSREAAETVLSRLLGLEDAPRRRFPRAPRAVLPEACEEGELGRRLEQEIEHYRAVENVHDLPRIYHYWSEKYLRPVLAACGIEGIDAFFLDHILSACRTQPGGLVEIASIGSGNGDLEVRLARAARARGAQNFRFRCFELNPHMIARGRALAIAEDVADQLEFVRTNIDHWSVDRPYAICLAHHSLHHIVALEPLFAKVRRAIGNEGVFLISDMIGRNGHQRWPEVLGTVQELWRQMPDRYKWNQQLRRFEKEFEDWDCSREGNEGIRSQDILPLLMEHFHFEVFVPFGNLIDVFVDRSFGHNFDPEREEDRRFIDEVARLDLAKLDAGEFKPTHLLAAARVQPVEEPVVYRHWTPEFCLRRP